MRGRGDNWENGRYHEHTETMPHGCQVYQAVSASTDHPSHPSVAFGAARGNGRRAAGSDEVFPPCCTLDTAGSPQLRCGAGTGAGLRGLCASG